MDWRGSKEHCRKDPKNGIIYLKVMIDGRNKRCCSGI